MSEMVNKNKKRNEKLPKKNIILVIFEIYLNGKYAKMPRNGGGRKDMMMMRVGKSEARE